MKKSFTQKPYYKKYYKKIVLILNRTKNMKTLTEYKIENNLKKVNDYKKVYKEIINQKLILEDTNIDFKSIIPYGVGKFTIYYNDDNLLNYIDKKFSIIEQSLPLANQENIQNIETNSIIRNSYFYKKYKFKLHFKLTDKKWYSKEARKEKFKKYNEIVNLLQDIHKTNFDNKVKIGNYSVVTPIMYFTDEDDVFYLKLLYDTEIIQIDKIILIKDVI